MNANQDSSASICACCASVPLQSYFQPNFPFSTPCTREPHQYPEPVAHDLLADVLYRKDSCKFCRLIGHAIHAAVNEFQHLPLPSLDDGEISLNKLFGVANDTQIRCFIRSEATEMLESEFLLIPNQAFRVVITLRLEGSSKTVQTIPDVTQIRGMLQLLDSSAEILNTTPHHLGREVGSSVDLELLRRWLDICAEHHDHYTPSTRRPPSPFTINLIDIHQRRIFSSGPGDGYINYAALSYTWGGDQKFKLLQSNYDHWIVPGGLPDFEQLPKTIKQAIELASQMGKRYLWVDALCIIQDNKQARDAQLQQMNWIYELAEFTIVAAAGSDAEAGLPGIVPGSRSLFQLTANIQGLNIAVPFPTLNSTIPSTKWNTRGWTYQEQLLSNTVIIFTPHQVYFQCDRKVFQEDVHIELEGRLRNITWEYPGIPLSVSMERLNTFRTLSLFIHEGSPTGIFERYKNIVEIYATRDFGDPGDILPGFIGITNAFQRAPGSMGYVAGLSVAGFEDALLWVPKGPLSRRRNLQDEIVYPSWSFFGWKGGCQIEGISDPQAPLVGEWFAVHGAEEKRSRLPMVTYDAGHFRDRPLTGPFSAKGSGSWDVAHSHALEFKTFVGSFYITGQQHFERGFPVLSRRHSHDINSKLVTMCIFDEEDHWVGTVMIAENEGRGISGRVRREFLAISTRGSPVGCYADPSLYSTNWRKALNVIMAERINEREFERLAVAVIYEDAWKAGKPIEEYVRFV